MGGSLQRQLSHPLLRSSGPKGGLYSPNAPASQDSAQKSVSAGTWSPVKHGLRQSQDVCLEPEHTSAALASCVADAQAGAQRPLKASVCATLRSVSTETSCSGKHQRKGSGNGAARRTRFSTSPAQLLAWPPGVRPSPHPDFRSRPACTLRGTKVHDFGVAGGAEAARDSGQTWPHSNTTPFTSRSLKFTTCPRVMKYLLSIVFSTLKSRKTVFGRQGCRNEQPAPFGRASLPQAPARPVSGSPGRRVTTPAPASPSAKLVHAVGKSARAPGLLRQSTRVQGRHLQCHGL